MRAKRILITALAAALAGSMLAGCSSDDPASPGNQVPTSSSEQAALSSDAQIPSSSAEATVSSSSALVNASSSFTQALGECSDERLGEIKLYESRYYNCNEYTKPDWRLAYQDEIDTYGVECVEGATTHGKVNTYLEYACEKGEFDKLYWVQKTHVPGTPCGIMETWYGDMSQHHIRTNCDEGNETSGYWFIGDDNKEGGASFYDWPGGFSYIESLDPIIDECPGMCGTYQLQKRSLDKDPYISLNFNVGGEDDWEEGLGFIPFFRPFVVDASSWGGLCVSYYSDDPISLELNLNSGVATELPADTLGRVVNIPWSEFVSADSSAGLTGEEAAKKVATISFKIQGSDGTRGRFHIMSVGPYNGGCLVIVPPFWHRNLR